MQASFYVFLSLMSINECSEEGGGNGGDGGSSGSGGGGGGRGGSDGSSGLRRSVEGLPCFPGDRLGGEDDSLGGGESGGVSSVIRED